MEPYDVSEKRCYRFFARVKRREIEDALENLYGYSATLVTEDGGWWPQIMSERIDLVRALADQAIERLWPDLGSATTEIPTKGDAE